VFSESQDDTTNLDLIRIALGKKKPAKKTARKSAKKNNVFSIALILKSSNLVLLFLNVVSFPYSPAHKET
jgi:hypothetical protein